MFDKSYIILFMLMMLLGGCESSRVVKSPEVSLSKNTNDTTVMSDALDDSIKMERCRRELDALRNIDNTLYIKRKTEFDNLMSGASLYTGVREEVGDYTQSALDSLYRFKAYKLCADISNEVLNGLIKATS